MADVVEIAEHVLDRTGPIDAARLHQLLYLCQSWHLAWSGTPLFEDDFQAWAVGPVVPALAELHAGEPVIHPGQLRAAAQAREMAQKH